MPYMEFPGVEYTEKEWDGSSAITGGATDLCGVIVYAQKGPINKPVLIKSIDQYIETFGSYMENSNAMYSIRGFFKNGGSQLYVNRVVHYNNITDASTFTAKKAKVSVKDSRGIGAEDTLTFVDRYFSDLGNKYEIKVVDKHRVQSKTTKEALLNTDIVTCKIAREFVVGDYITLKNNALTETKKIISLDYIKNEIKLESKLTNAFPNNSDIFTADFTVEVYETNISGPQLKETHVGLNMDNTTKYYAPIFIDEHSKLIDCIDENIELNNVYERNPKTSDTVFYKLTGGDNGLTNVSDTDIIGDATSKTGLYAFDNIHDMIHIWTPESSQENVIRTGYDYCTAKMTAMFFASVPKGLNQEKAAEFRDIAGWDTSYGVLYFNNGYVSDPIGVGSNPLKLIPLTGHVLGALCKNDKTNANGYGSAPAGESVVLLDVVKLEYDIDATNGGILYGNKNRNINPIVKLLNGGIVVWGSRTQSSNKKWFQIHARRVFIYCETTIVSQTRWIAFKNKDNALYSQIQRRVKKFLGTLKGLRGDTDEERYEFVCDSTINDPEDSYVIGRIGLNIVSVGEFVWFEFGQRPEGVSLANV